MQCPPSIPRCVDQYCVQFWSTEFEEEESTNWNVDEGVRYVFIYVKDYHINGANLFSTASEGFGPFRQHLVNSSWEATKELSKLGLGNDVDLHIIELPVVYQKAKEFVCKAWSSFQPKLMIHIGLASTSKAAIILEQCGKNKVYKEIDVCGFCPEDGCCVLEGPERIESTINMKQVWKNIKVEQMDVLFSRDAGRYTCDYTYYISLYHGNGRAAFIHVPPLSKWVSAELLGRALQTIILEMLKQCK